MTVRGAGRGLAALALCQALCMAVLTGCGTASAPSPPTGVDGLVVPTPTPDPDDFVVGVDNPWFPLEQGTRWTYEVADPAGSHLLRVRVEAGPEIAGVATTALVSTERRTTVADYYAQDDAGNVWWFGREGRWSAGTDGAEAGVAMLAAPRVGDGYLRAHQDDVVEDAARVVALDGTATVPAGSYDDLVVVEVRSAPAGGTTQRGSYARGVGLVEETTVTGSPRSVRLRSVAQSG